MLAGLLYFGLFVLPAPAEPGEVRRGNARVDAGGPVDPAVEQYLRDHGVVPWTDGASGDTP